MAFWRASAISSASACRVCRRGERPPSCEERFVPAPHPDPLPAAAGRGRSLLFQRRAERVEQEPGALLARAGVVVAVEKGALLGDLEPRLRALALGRQLQ